MLKKKISFIILLIPFVLLAASNNFRDPVRIGVVSSTVPTSSAILEVISTAKGLLPPKMTTTQRDAVASPVAGLFIFNTSTNELNFYTGAAWSALSAGTASIASVAYGDAASAADGNPIIWPTEDFDTDSAYNNATGRFTAPSSGRYRVCAAIISSDAGRTVYANVNAADTRLMGLTDANGDGYMCAVLNVSASDILDVRPDGGALDVSSGASNVSFEKLGGG